MYAYKDCVAPSRDIAPQTLRCKIHSKDRNGGRQRSIIHRNSVWNDYGDPRIEQSKMSLYYEAAAAIANAENVGGSLKSRIYGNKKSKAPPAQIYALVSETTRWSLVLKDVVEKSGVLKLERKVGLWLSPMKRCAKA